MSAYRSGPEGATDAAVSRKSVSLARRKISGQATSQDRLPLLSLFPAASLRGGYFRLRRNTSPMAPRPSRAIEAGSGTALPSMLSTAMKFSPRSI